MRATNRWVRLAILQALTCTSGLLLTTPGRANADPAHFDIGAQPLPEAVRRASAARSSICLFIPVIL